jgi:hypothetical protein
MMKSEIKLENDEQDLICKLLNTKKDNDYNKFNEDLTETIISFFQKEEEHIGYKIKQAIILKVQDFIEEETNLNKTIDKFITNSI